MVKKEQKAIYTEKNKINKIINYFEAYGKISNATVELPNGKKAIIRPYNGMLEVVSDDVAKLNELEEILKKNE